MNEPTIGRLLGLVEKTGDKVIVTDPAGEHPYVLMSLDQYERLVGSAKPVMGKPVIPKGEMPVAPKPEPRPVSAPKPMNVQGFAKPADLWRSKLGLDAVEPQPRDLFKQTPKPQTASLPLAATQFETEGEEQFYMEPLE